MLPEVIELQDKAVSELIEKVNESLPRNSQGEPNTITFKAPTGSGKTYMMADFMNRILESNEDVIFLVSSLSKGDLAKQNYEKFLEYSRNHYFSHLKPYLINTETTGESRLYIPTDYNVYVLPRDLYKEKGKLKRGVLSEFLRKMTTPIALGGLYKKIFLIKDECHIQTTNLDNLANSYFEKIINFSATPKLSRGQKPDVEIKEIDAVNAHLIKSVKYQNENDNLSFETELNAAFDTFINIKERYIKKVKRNPCMIIQISNKDKADEEIQVIKDLLTKRGLQWMLIVENDKNCDTSDKFKKIPVNKWKEYAKKDLSPIDIIIFKMVITEGWDIPRACMLYQVRDSKSKQLDEQVIGRVRRNPRLLDYETLDEEAKELISTAYVWGLKEKENLEVRKVELAEAEQIQNELKLKTTVLRRNVAALELTPRKHEQIQQLIYEPSLRLAPHSIFDLYRKYKKLSPDLKETVAPYINNFEHWFNCVENIEQIQKTIKEYAYDYTVSLTLLKDDNGNITETPLPKESYYIENNEFSIQRLNDWIWSRSDNEHEFSFDSSAEKEWLCMLFNLKSEDSKDVKGSRIIKHICLLDEPDNKKYLIGKNFLANSDIKYEYYLEGIRSSYPDFIMKDHLNRIHIFEVKSLNKSSRNNNLDSTEYETKIQELRKAYKQASLLTGYYFYIPIQQGENWTIHSFFNGEEKRISYESFVRLIKNNIPFEDLP